MGTRRDGKTTETDKLISSTIKPKPRPSSGPTPTVIPTGATLKQGTVLNKDDDPVIFSTDKDGNTVGENRYTYGQTETTSASITAQGELV